MDKFINFCRGHGLKVMMNNVIDTNEVMYMVEGLKYNELYRYIFTISKMTMITISPEVLSNKYIVDIIQAFNLEDSHI
jgi:hypothetical protein